MENMNHTEGYADGLAGRDVQPRGSRSIVETWWYVRGYALGAIDRVAMTDKVIADWFEGLTAGDVMQAVN